MGMLILFASWTRARRRQEGSRSRAPHHMPGTLSTTATVPYIVKIAQHRNILNDRNGHDCKENKVRRRVSGNPANRRTLRHVPQPKNSAEGSVLKD